MRQARSEDEIMQELLETRRERDRLRGINVDAKPEVTVLAPPAKQIGTH
jgi:hypothetical protein